MKTTIRCPQCRGEGSLEVDASKALGISLVGLRKGLGLTQHQLADASRIARTNIANMECGRSGTTIPNLMKLAAFFGCSIDELLGLPRMAEGEG